MTRSLITATATAIGLVLAGPVFADSPMARYVETPADGDLQASDLIGMRIYATENEIGEDTMIAEGGEREWDDIGEVNDVVLGRDGMVKAVVLGVGGFLGVGEKDVAIEMSSLKFVDEQDDPGDYFLVVNSSKAMLEEAPTFVGREMAEMSAEMAEQRDEMTAKPEAEEMAANEQTAESPEMAANDQTAESVKPMPERPMLTPPAVEREGYLDTSVEDLTAEMLQGIAVYGPKDESVGEIGELILDEGGQITNAVIDVGGFLGIGEREVSVTFDELRVLRQDGGDDVRVYIDSSAEQLEQLPEYEG